MTDPGGDRPDLPIRPYERREAHVRDWDPRTLEVAARIAAMVRRRRPDLDVEHIGSTAVPGLPGKGIVDLSVEVEAGEIPAVVELLYGLGFGPQPGPDPWPTTRPMIVGAVDVDGEEFRIHVHVQPVGGDMPRDLAFRDALRNDPELMRQYSALKTRITRGRGVDSLRYTHSKTAWILGVYKALGFRPPAILPPATIGILDGGRRAALLALAARSLGYRIAVLDPDPECPAASMADRVEVARLDDIEAARRLAVSCAVITIAAPTVSLDVVRALDGGGAVLRPGPYALKLTHDAAAQRDFIEANGAAVASTPTAGSSATPTGAAENLSVIVARGVDGLLAGYPVARALGRPGSPDGPVATCVPSGIEATIETAALDLAGGLATGMGLVGLLTAEFVVGPDDSLAVAALAPRVDDAGDWTIEATVTSQYEQQVRAICCLPLGSTELRVPAAATVHLAGSGPDRDARPSGVEAVLEAPDVHLHLDGVRRTGAGRIMGHVTAVAATADAALAAASAAASRVRWDEREEGS
ncbi:MAG: GrpB family protein [Chloroflexota bacterium]